MRQPALLVDVRHDLPRPLLRLAGELDVATAPLLTAVLDHLRQRQSGPAGHDHVLDILAATTAATGTATATVSGARSPQPSGGGHLQVDVDLRQVSFADSHGLAPLLDSRAQVLAASPPVWRVLHLLADAGLRQTDRQPDPLTGARPQRQPGRRPGDRLQRQPGRRPGPRPEQKPEADDRAGPSLTTHLDLHRRTTRSSAP